MKTRALLLCGAAALACLSVPSNASACDGTAGGIIRTAIPTMADIQAVPRLRDGRLVNYPVRVVRYGLNIHPGARLVRAALFR